MLNRWLDGFLAPVRLIGLGVEMLILIRADCDRLSSRLPPTITTAESGIRSGFREGGKVSVAGIGCRFKLRPGVNQSSILESFSLMRRYLVDAEETPRCGGSRAAQQIHVDEA